jgi:hypothetical protein
MDKDASPRKTGQTKWVKIDPFAKGGLKCWL